MANTSDSLKKRFIAQISEPNPGYEMICLDENHYKMTSDYAEGEINFYDQDIVEFRIVKKETDVDVFSIVKLDVIDGKVVIESTIED